MSEDKKNPSTESKATPSTTAPLHGQQLPGAANAPAPPLPPIHQQQEPGASSAASGGAKPPGGGATAPHEQEISIAKKRARDAAAANAEKPNLTQQQIEGPLMAQYAAQGRPPSEARKLARERAQEMCSSDPSLD